MAALGRGPAATKGEHVGRRQLVLFVVGGFLVFLVLVLSSRYNASVLIDRRRGDFRPRQGQGESNGGDKAVTEPAGRHIAAAAATSNSDEHAEPEAEEEDRAKSSVTAPAVPTTSPRRHQLPGDDMTTSPADHVGQQRRPLCDLSGFRADVCDLSGDIRMDANASAFLVVGADGGETAAYRVRPYARKGDATSMGRVTEITVRAAHADDAAPRCTATHADPAVVFSVGGYAGNLFHDFTDVLLPLYDTARRFRGGARLVVTDAASAAAARWLARYGALLRAMSRHAPLDLAAAAAAGEVHCFRRAVVGLRAHRELTIERQRERGTDGLVVTTADFTRFLRRALSLPRDVAAAAVGTRPRLLVVARRGTRLLLNADAVVRAAEEVGFEAVVSDLDAGGDDVARVGRLVNSFDAMVGVHGAGLTNMVFLPPGATVVQIVPWGGLQWIARMDFGDPAEDMGLRYIQYEIAVHESTLKDKYPRDHDVFTNPTALHKKGFKFLRHTFLNGQDVIVDVQRFRAVLLQAMNNLHEQ